MDLSNFRHELTPRDKTFTLAATVDNVRKTCRDLVANSEGPVIVDTETAVSYIDRLDTGLLKGASHLMKNAVRFPDISSEITFHITLHMFNFAHGYRHLLHEVCGRGAWQTMKMGVESMQGSAVNGYIDTETLISLSKKDVDRHFGFPAAGTAADDDRLDPLRVMIFESAVSSGRRLLELGYRTFTEFIEDHSVTEDGNRPSAVKLVESLADHFPHFDDRRRLPDGKEVLFLKKAQLAVAELYQRLGADRPGCLNFGDVEKFTVVCDNVLPCVLRVLGIIRIDPALERRIDAREPLPAGTEEAFLRAAGVFAAEMMLEQGDGRFWAKELGDYLWTLGKEPGFRGIERHAVPDTCFY